MKRIFTIFLTVIMLVCLAVPALVSATEPDRVTQMIDNMTLRDKVTQMFLMDIGYWDEDTSDDVGLVAVTEMNEQVQKFIEDYNFGAVIYFAQNLTGTEQAFNLTMDLQTAAVKDGGIPMLICADQEGGRVYRLGSGTALPGNMALGAAGDLSYAKKTGQIIGSELSAVGINTTLAPVVDVNNNANNPVIGLRSYSDDPKVVGDMASATIEGMSEYNVIGCAKHFPGHGDTDTDSHYGLPVVDKSMDELTECELVPFKSIVDSGVEMIMVAHILYPQLETDKLLSEKTGVEESVPASMSDDIITGILKGDMSFDGIVVTDALNMAGITDYWDGVQAAVTAIQAGADMLCMPCSVQSLDDMEYLEVIINGIIEAVDNGEISMSRINDAVRRILTVKENSGILDWNADSFSLDNAKVVVGGTENRAAEREIASAAVTLIQNKDYTLPLQITAESKVLMMVPYNNETAQMAMGWNRAKEAGLIPDGAEVKVVRFDGESTVDTFKADIEWADTIIINSEVSVASQMNGGSWVSAYPIAVINHAENLGKITVVQSVDNPYDVQSYPNADAVLAVYGCKGSALEVDAVLKHGITASADACGPNITAGVEVMFGVYEPQGTLPVNIPVIENGKYTEEIAFERGFGLEFTERPAPEQEDVEEEPEAKAGPGMLLWIILIVAVVAIVAVVVVILVRKKKEK